MSQSAASRMRRQTRRTVNGSSTSAISSHNPYSSDLVLQRGQFGNPRWYAEDIRLPDEVAPGGVVDIAVDMVNKDRVVTPLNPNVCRDGSFSGLESEITVDPTWTESESVIDCLGITSGLNPTRRTHEFGFEAPSEPGTYSVDVSVIATGDNSGGTETVQIVVPEDDQSDPRPGPGDGDDSPPNDDDDSTPDGPGLFNQTTILGIVAVIAGIAALALS